MKAKLIIIPILCFLSFVEMAMAGQAVGKVDTILIRDSDGLIYFYLKDYQITEAKPACATNSYWMIKDESSATAKHQLSVLLAAQMSGKRVKVWGYNTCTRWHDGEDVNTLQLYAD